MLDSITAIQSVADLQAARRTVEELAAEQFELVAESFDSANNAETAAMFMELAEWERSNRNSGPQGPLLDGFEWYPVDPGDPLALHYLMTPFHAVSLALDNKKRIYGFFQKIATTHDDADMRALALDFANRTRSHIDALSQKLSKLPEPEAGWDEDLDPPNYDME